MAINIRGKKSGPVVVEGAGWEGWEDPTDEITRRVVFMLIYGDTDTGRTRLALTAPGPIALVHAAEKIDGLVQQFKQTRGAGQLHMFNFGGVHEGTPQQISDSASAMWGKVHVKWMGAVDHGLARTAIMDTASEGWELVRLASFGTLKPEGRTDNLYGPVNAKFRSMWKRFRMQEKCNIIAIQQTKDEYVERMHNGKKVSNRTGDTIMAGFKEMPFLADVIVRTSRTPDNGYCATIEKPWFNGDARGIEFLNDDITFPNIMALITGMDAKEWS